ncbi:hypothetical protein CMV_018026 [Castanea mollissima]|uniref:Uncharacterized protein n=1 Tax=Castanea mollissima TaxID=60419 RepID=A0A8J4QS48_9ROSI|nr:hypothetical protein CMV_018026 [Castanea mollissima]
MLLSTPTVPPAQPLLRLASFDKSELGLSDYPETHKSLSSDLSLGLHGFISMATASNHCVPLHQFRWWFRTMQRNLTMLPSG